MYRSYHYVYGSTIEHSPAVDDVEFHLPIRRCDEDEFVPLTEDMPEPSTEEERAWGNLDDWCRVVAFWVKCREIAERGYEKVSLVFALLFLSFPLHGYSVLIMASFIHRNSFFFFFSTQ